MPAIQSGLAYVAQGSTQVRHVWNLVVGNYVAFSANADLQWAGGGIGQFISYDFVTAQLLMVRVSGPDPSAGVTISSWMGGSCAVIQYGPGTPSHWELATIGGTPVYFHRAGSGMAYQVSSFDARGDLLTLSNPYAEMTELAVSYGITQDYTQNFGIPIVQLGDIDALTVLSIALTKIDSLFQSVRNGQLFDDDTLALIPDADPHIKGRLWANSGVLTRSNG